MQNLCGRKGILEWWQMVLMKCTISNWKILQKIREQTQTYSNTLCIFYILPRNKKRVEIQFSVRRKEPRVRKERKFLTFRSHTTFVTEQNFENQDDSVSIFDDSVGKDDSSLRKQLSLPNFVFPNLISRKLSKTRHYFQMTLSSTPTSLARSWPCRSGRPW